MTVRLAEASCLRKLNQKYIDYTIELRRYWLESDRRSFPGDAQFIDRIPEKIVNDLYTVCNVLLAATNPYRHVVSHNSLRIYTNDTALFDQLASTQTQLTWPRLTEAIVNRDKDTVKLKNPKHKLRSYFKRVKLTNVEKKIIINFLANYHDDIRLSPCLHDWTTQPFKWLEPYYFIDHDEESWLVMLSLVRPGLIKKTLSIIKA